MDRDEEYIISESQEIAVGESSTWVSKIIGAFPALKNHNYQLYFYGQLVSLIGTWLQVVAEGWLVLQLTNSAFLLGVVMALSSLPSLFFSLFGGVIIDRFPKRTVLLYTQSTAMVLALIYGLLTVFHFITIYEIAILAFLLGIVNAVDIPARQAFVVELVPDEARTSAIALNSGVFNAARVVGPSVAGILIALIGSGGAFILNGISYIAVIIALFFIHVTPYIKREQLHPLQSIKEGVVYAYSHPVIRTLLIFTGVVSIFGWSYSTVMPYIAKNTFGLNADGLGYIYAASGLGALVGSLMISALSKKVSPIVFILCGNTVFALSVILFTLTHTLWFALPLLFSLGVGLLSQFATINTTIQSMVDNSKRGRVMSLYTLMFLGLSPIGNFEVGFISQHFGPGIALQIGAVIVLGFGAYLYLTRNKIREAQKVYTENLKNESNMA